MTEVIQQAINALALGSIYALLALGMAIMFSIMRLINFAYGELVTIAGYTMFVLVEHGVSWVIVPVAGVAAAIAGALLMERVAFRPVRGASVTTMLITSFGVSVTLQGAFLVFISPRPRPVPAPDWLAENIEIGSLNVQSLQVLSAGATGVALVALVLFLRRSIHGVAMRAAAESFTVTRLMGVKANRVIVGSFAISGALAGVAGVLWVARRTSVDPSMGLVPVIKAFIATVIGGLGSLPGAVIGGFALGALDVGFSAFLPTSLSPFQTAFALVAVIVILSVRPQGLRPVTTTERA